MSTYMSGEEHSNQPIEKPIVSQEQEHQPGVHADRSGHKIRRAVAAVTMLGIGVGIGYTASELQSDRPEISAAQPDGPDLSAREKLDFEAAIDADTCENKVTLKEVESTYEQLFKNKVLDEEKPSLSTLKKASHDLLAKFDTTKKQIEFNKLPDEMYAFINKAYSGGFKEDYPKYEHMFRQYLDSFGIQLLDKWPAGSEAAQKLEQAGIDAQTLTAQRKEELKDNFSAKVQIVRAMQGLATIPRSIVEQYGPKTIVLAEFTDHRYDGYAFGDKRIIALNTRQPKGTTFQNAQSLHDPSIMGHEVSHLYNDALCSNIISNYVDDPGFTSLNRSFAYSERHYKQLQKGRIIQNQYTTLDQNISNEQAVVAKAYGARNVEEDKATLLGEKILYTGGLYSLMPDTETDATIIHEKLAYLLVRMQNIDPQIASYYKTLVQITEMADKAEHVATILVDKLDELTPDAYKESMKIPPELKNNKEYNALLEEEQRYIALTGPLWAAIYESNNTSAKPQVGMK